MAAPDPHDASISGRKNVPGKTVELAGYELLSKLGQGGMGAVYKARQKSLDRLVAVKILPPKAAQNEQFIERFRREAMASAKLKHPNIVQGIDVGQDRGLYYFVMELVEGRSLARMLKDGNVFGEQQALQIIRQVAAALDCAHQAGLVHRDIKPDNILLTNDGTAKLADLGLVKEAGEDSSLTRTGTSVGTPHYISPEQAKGEKDVDIRSDLYSLGATWFCLVTGRPPFEGETSAVVMVKHLNEPAPKAHRVNPAGVSESTGRLIERLLRKNREQRVRTPKELIRLLDELAASKKIATATRPMAPIRRSPTTERKRHGVVWGWWVAAAGGGLALVALAAVLLFGGKASEQKKKYKPDGGHKTVAHVEPPPTPPKTPSPPEPKKTAADDLNEMLDYVRIWEEKHPDAFEELRARYEKVGQAAEKSPLGMKILDEVREALQRVDGKRAAAAERVWKDVHPQVRRAAEEQNFDEALRSLTELPERWVADLKEKTEATAEKLRTDAEERLQNALQRATEASAALEPEKGLAALEEVKNIRYAPLQKTVSDLKEKLTVESADVADLKRKREEARETALWEERMKTFDEAVLSGDWATADAVGRKALEEPWKGKAAAEAAALADMLRTRKEEEARGAEAWKNLVGREADWRLQSRNMTVKGKIVKVDAEKRILSVAAVLGPGVSMTVHVQWHELSNEDRQKLIPEPEEKASPERAMVAALQALTGWKDKKEAERVTALAEAKRRLAEAEAFALTERWRKRVNVLAVGEAEAAAEEKWGELERTVAAEKNPDKKFGETLLTQLVAFEEKHLRTRFGEEKIDRFRQWKDWAETLVVGFDVRKLFKGRVDQYVPETREIVLYYDFNDTAQTGDWLSAPDGSPAAIKNGTLVSTRGDRPFSLTHTATFAGDLDLTFNTPPRLGHSGCVALVYQDKQKDGRRGSAGVMLTGGAKLFGPLPGYEKGGEKKPAEAFEAARWYDFELKFHGAGVTFAADGKVLETWEPGAFPALRPEMKISIRAGDYVSESTGFKNIRIKGVLNHEWVEQKKNEFKTAQLSEAKSGPTKTASVAPVVPPPLSGTTIRWTNAGGDGQWASAANWDLKRTPRAGDNVLFDQTCVAPCIAVRGGVAQNLKTLTLTAGYTGTITFEPEFAEGNSQELTVAGDVTILGGSLIVSGLIRGEGKNASGFGVALNAANFTVGPNAVLHSDARGFPVHTGLGCGEGTASGGAHGGDSLVHGKMLNRTYGSPDESVTLGSGGGGGGGDLATSQAKGGGAIKIVAGDGRITLDGVIRCNGGSNRNSHGGAAGGGIYLICGTFAGGSDGKLMAIGGSSNKFGGGGGRIAVYYKTKTFAGEISAAGGMGGANKGDGGEGTIVLKPR